MNTRKEPEKIRQKAIAPLKTDGKIQTRKAVCHFDYYLRDSREKWQPRVYLCEHRTLADIFLEAALFDPKKNVLCISKAEWDSSPEEARRALRKFEKIFREPYQASPVFVRRLFDARQDGKSILFPITDDARGMDRNPCLDEKGVFRLCRKLEMPVCTVAFREEQTADFYFDVKLLFTPEDLKEAPVGKPEAMILERFQKETKKEAETEFREKKRSMMRKFLKSELNEAVPVEISHCSCTGQKRAGMCDAEILAYEAKNADSMLRMDMTGITLEISRERYHRSPGALRSVAVYPGKKPGTEEKGTILIFPYYDRVFYLFTDRNEDAINIQAAVEQMYEIVSAQ